MVKVMRIRRLLMIIGVCLMGHLVTNAQINTQIPGTWSVNPSPYVVTDPGLVQTDVTILDYSVARNFYEATTRSEPDLSQVLYIHKHIRLNTQKAVDSLANYMIPKIPNADPYFMEARVIHPNGKFEMVKGYLRTVKLSKDEEAWVMRPENLEVGCEIEYDFGLLIYNQYSGVDYFQENSPVLKANFKLIAPNTFTFDVKGLNGFGDISPIAGTKLLTAEASSSNIPAISNSIYMFPKPNMQAVAYAMSSFVNQTYNKKEKVTYTWQDFGESEFITYNNISRTEFNNLQKNMERWAFLKQQKALPLLIYQVEHYLKSIIKYEPAENIQQLEDLSYILRNREANDVGLVRLFSAVYYMLGIRTELLLTSPRDELQIDSTMCSFDRAKKPLLYFPEIDLCMAPTEYEYHFPNIPPLWANTTALHCWDVKDGDQSEVKTAFMQVPAKDYAGNGSRTVSNIRLTASMDSLLITSSQTINGLPDVSVKTMFKALNANQYRDKAAQLLPVAEKDIHIKALSYSNTDWSPTEIEAPTNIKGTYTNASLLTKTNNGIEIRLGGLNPTIVSANNTLPPRDKGLDILYPFFQESKITIEIPAGYTLANPKYYDKEFTVKDGAKEVAGFKSMVMVDGNNLTYYITQWYGATHYELDVFDQLHNMLGQLLQLKESPIVLKRK